MALKIYDTLVPQGNYPAVNAAYVAMPDGTTLDEFKGAEEAVLYTAQTLTEEQKLQARQNIDAASATDMENEIDRLDERISNIGTGGGSITVDSALDMSSTNPVQNKVITQVFLEAQTALEALTPDDALSETSTKPVQNKVIYAQLVQANTVLQQLAASIPTEASINALIDAKLGVIENGAY